ncbi:MAG: hypothetical protein ABH872_00625 [Candidatus Omnitrophota bacterium]
MKTINKKGNAIVEYSVLLFIVIGFLSSMHYFLNRHIQARVRHETNQKVRRPMPFIWQSSVEFSSQKANHDRKEYAYGDTIVESDFQTSYTVLSAPPPPKVPLPIASLHIQDAAMPAPGQSNPGHRRMSHDEGTNPED